MEKRESSYAICGNKNWYGHYVEYHRHFIKKLGIKLPYDPAISLLSIYLEETINEKDTCTPKFIAALFTITRTWKQARCAIDRWMDDEVMVYTQLNITPIFTAIKRMHLSQF